MLIGIDHVQITIPKNEENKAKSFYCELLGLKEIAKPENRRNNGGFWLQLGKVQLHVGTENGVDRNLTKAHVAYLVDDLEKWRNILSQDNVEVKDSAPFPSAKAFEFRDPFGNRLELIQQL